MSETVRVIVGIKMREREIICFEDQGQVYKPKNAGGFQKMKRIGKRDTAP